MYRLEWHVATSFMPLNSDLMSVCACALAQMLKTRLGDHHFNHKQVSDVYCVIRNFDSVQRVVKFHVWFHLGQFLPLKVV